MSSKQSFELMEKLNAKVTKDDESLEEGYAQFDEEAEYKISQKKVQNLAQAFMFLFIAYGSSTSLISSLYKQLNYTNLGLMSLFSTYFVFAFAAFFAKGIVQKFSFSTTFMFSSFGYTLCIAAGIWVNLCNGSDQLGMCSDEIIYFVVNFCAGLCGLCASTLWVAQGGYVDILSNTCPSKKGVLIGEFFSVVFVSGVVGCVLASFLISIFGNMSYFLMNTAISLFSGYQLFKVPDPNSPNAPKQENDQIQTKPLKDQIKEIIDLLKDSKVCCLIPFFWLQGTVLGCYAQFLFQVVNNSLSEEDSIYAPKYVSYISILLGVSQIISSRIIGKLSDKINIYVILIGATVLCSAAIIFSLVGLLVKSYSLCFFIGIIWGAADCANQSLAVIVASKEFPGQLQIFSLQKLVSSLSCALILIAGILLDGYPPFYILLIVFGIQFTATISLASQLSFKQEVKQI